MSHQSHSTISLKAAIDQIKQACEDRNQQGQASPFFFIAGAGISFPPLPLAGIIQKECKALALERGRSEEPASQEPIDTYSYWFEAAFPQRIQRQAYLRDKIEGKPISHANFRLAHLLLDGTVSNLVVTPNFDDQLHRALRLFGKSPIICDHPKTVERIYHEQDKSDIRIVHVHGTYWFYDCANLRGEIAERAQAAAQPALTMEALLSKILADRSPLVIGYSGWEGDVIMSSLRRHLLSREPPFNLYWFCYKRSDIERLPAWLTDRQEYQDVFFVVPDEGQSEPSVSEGNKVNEGSDGVSVSNDLGQSNLPPHPADHDSEEAVLTAQHVFDALIAAFDLPAPELAKAPLTFFADSLRSSLPADEGDASKGAPYFFGSIIERIEKATANESELQTQLEKVRDFVRRSQYTQVATTAYNIPVDNLTKTDMIDLLNILKTAAPQVVVNTSEQKLLYTSAGKIADTLMPQSPPDDLAMQKLIAWALACKVYSLLTLSLWGASNTVCDQIVQRYEDKTDSELRERVAWALMRKGSNLEALTHDNEAITAYDEIVKRFDAAQEIAVQKHVASALLGKASKLNTLKRFDEVVTACDELIRRFSSATDPAICQNVLQATALKETISSQQQKKQVETEKAEPVKNEAPPQEVTAGQEKS